MKINKIASAIGFTLAISAVANAGVLPQSQTQSQWYESAQTTLATKQNQAQEEQQEEELLLGFGSFYTVCDILKNNNKEKRSL